MRAMMVRLSYPNVAPLVGVHKPVHCVVVMCYGLKRRDRFARRGEPGYTLSLALQSPRGKRTKDDGYQPWARSRFRVAGYAPQV